MKVQKDLAKNVALLLEEHLENEEKRRRAVSRVATGAAFEGWLAIETRLQMECHRERLGLTGQRTDTHEHPVDRYWICNEYTKVDLGVIDYDPDFDNWVTAIEFKLITNNKNWPKKVDEVRADLYPKRGSKKHKIKPRLGRFALVAVMGKVFRDPGPYGWREDLVDWEDELRGHMLPRKGRWAGAVKQVWESQRFPLDDCWLSKNHDGQFLQLKMFAPTDQR